MVLIMRQDQFHFTQNAVNYTWRQLARRAGISFSNGQTGFEGLDIPLFHGSPEHALFTSPGVIVRRSVNENWNTILSAPENSLHWKPVRETLPVGGKVPFGANIPILFWGEGAEDGKAPFAERREDGTIVFNADILSSCFFMLSRLEEIIKKARDNHGRFSAFASTAYRQNFLDIPLVDQYALILREWIKTLKTGWSPVLSQWKIKLSHDIDRPLRYSGPGGYPRALGSALLREHDLARAWSHIIFARRLLSQQQDPYYRSIDELGRISRQFGFASSFYFMAARPGPHQTGYDPASSLLTKCFRDLVRNGHTIGFHPGYSTLNNPAELVAEKEKLEVALGRPVTEGRQHYLRFEVPVTWRHWEQAGLTSDSSMGFADHEGFRCGTCWPYTPFDIEQDRELDLLEVPLTVMDGTLHTYRKMTPAEGKRKILEIARRCAEVGGTFTLLWHNSSFHFEWAPWKQIYIESLHDLASANIGEDQSH